MRTALLLLGLLPSSALAECVDPDGALSVSDKSRARSEYVKCLIDENRALQKAASVALADHTSELAGRVGILELELDRLKDQFEMLNLRANEHSYPPK